MKQFDEVIGKQFGIFHGKDKIVFIKTGRGGSIEGYENKYLNICSMLSERYGCTFVVSANLVDSQCDLEDELRQINELVDHYDEIVFVGISNGALVGAQQCWKNDRIKNALLINGPLMINWHKTKKGAEKFSGEEMRFVYGVLDPSYGYVEILNLINNSVCTKEILKGEGHNLSYATFEYVLTSFLDERLRIGEKSD